jgi:hypothetical protein
MQLETALDSMSSVNLNGERYVPLQNVKALCATHVEGTFKVGNAIKFAELPLAATPVSEKDIHRSDAPQTQKS